MSKYNFPEPSNKEISIGVIALVITIIAIVVLAFIVES